MNPPVPHAPSICVLTCGRTDRQIYGYGRGQVQAGSGAAYSLRQCPHSLSCDPCEAISTRPRGSFRRCVHAGEANAGRPEDGRRLLCSSSWKGWGSVTFSLKLDSQHFANVLIIGRVVVCLQMRLPRPSSIRVLKLQLNTCVWCGALSRQCLTVCGSCTLANKHQLSARLHCRMASLLTCLIMH